MRPPKLFESQHQSCPSFDVPVVLLNQIIKILGLPDGNRFIFCFVGVERRHSRPISATFINSHHLGFTVMTNGLAKEAWNGQR